MANQSSNSNNEIHQDIQGGSPHANSAGDGLAAVTGSADRHVGCVRKLLSTYGFIQYGEKSIQVFFHYSEYHGPLSELVIGDKVEFEVMDDHKNGGGRPLAVAVVKTTGDVALSVAGTPASGGSVEPDTEFRGTVMLVPKGPISKEGDGKKDGVSGRLSYEQNGECFYLPFSGSDVEGEVKEGDLVSFSVGTSSSGEGCAVSVHRLLFQGVVCSLKENFGFIERADVVKEIFFHYSEFNGDVGEIILGDDVEYEIQIRNGKEVAIAVTCLPSGSVIFEDVQVDTRRGKVKKAPRGGPRKGPGGTRGEPSPSGSTVDLPGLIVYNTIQCTVEIAFGEKDTSGDYTLFVGDVVNFQIATDRRDGLQRAVNVSVQPASFSVSREERRQGVVCSLKETYGFIRKLGAEGNIFFHFSELIKSDESVTVGDEVEFTSAGEHSGRSAVALRIVRLPRGTITMIAGASPVRQEIGSPASKGSSRMMARDYRLDLPLDHDDYQHQVPPQQQERAPQQQDAVPLAEKDRGYCGVVVVSDDMSTGESNGAASMNGAPPSSLAGLAVEYYDDDGKKKTVSINDAFTDDLRPNDRVAFQLTNDGKPLRATGVKCKEMGEERCGHVATVKETYGFIESLDLSEEVFFHFSICEDVLEPGDAVRYCVVTRGKKTSAEHVRKVNAHTFLEPADTKEVIRGKVIRTLKVWVNDQQPEYCGLIQAEPSTGKGDSEAPAPVYRFGMCSIVHRDHLVTVGEHVQFEPRRAPAKAVTNGNDKRSIDEKNSNNGNNGAANTAHRGSVNLFALSVTPSTAHPVIGRVDSVKGHYGFIMLTDRKTVYFHESDVLGGVDTMMEVAAGTPLGGLEANDCVSFHLIRSQRSNKQAAISVQKIQQARPDRLIQRLKQVAAPTAGPQLTITRQPKNPDGTKGFTKPRVLISETAN